MGFELRQPIIHKISTEANLISRTLEEVLKVTSPFSVTHLFVLSWPLVTHSTSDKCQTHFNGAHLQPGQGFQLLQPVQARLYGHVLGKPLYSI